MINNYSHVKIMPHSVDGLCIVEVGFTCGETVTIEADLSHKPITEWIAEAVPKLQKLFGIKNQE